jgi:putative ABC transport system substrate-binding protein
LGVNYFELGYQSGLMAAQILRGEGEPATMPIQFAQTYTYTVNGEIAELLSIAVPERLADYIVYPEN